MRADICPVCAGTGEYYVGELDCEGKLIGYRECHGCAGKGWVELHEKTCAVYPITLPELYPYKPPNSTAPYPWSITYVT